MFRNVFLLGLQCLLMSPRAVVDEIIECSFGAFALAKQQGLVDLLSNLLTKGGIEQSCESRGEVIGWEYEQGHGTLEIFEEFGFGWSAWCEVCRCKCDSGSDVAIRSGSGFADEFD